MGSFISSFWRALKSTTTTDMPTPTVFDEEIDEKGDVVEFMSCDDTKSFIQLIGSILIQFSNGCYQATATVFDYDNKTGDVYVITAARNLVIRAPRCSDCDFAQSVWFERLNTKNKSVQIYPCTHYLIHPKYINKNEMRENTEYDLGVLVFKDVDGFYKNIFNNKRNIIQLFSSDLITDDLILIYAIYGYDGRNNKREGKGMQAYSDSFKKHIGKKTNIKKKDNKFVYNAFIHTTNGFSGAAIFVQLNEGRYAIVGVHTNNNKLMGIRWGTALNNERLNWIKNNCNVNNDAILMDDKAKQQLCDASICIAEVSVLGLICPGSGKVDSVKKRKSAVAINGKNIIKTKINNDHKIYLKNSINLSGTIEDLNKLQKWLYAFDNIKYLSSMKQKITIKPYLSKNTTFNADLTKIDVVNKISKWMSTESVSEYVLYFSGHGSDDPSGIAACDEIVTYKCILEIVLSKIAMDKRVNVIVDACFSGGIIKALKQIKIDGKYNNKIKNVVCFYSSSYSEISADYGLEGGAFTTHIFDPQKYDLWVNWFSRNNQVNDKLIEFVSEQMSIEYAHGATQMQSPGIFWIK